MTARAPLPVALALLLACAGCAGRMGATPADLTPAGAPKAPQPPTAKAKPATPLQPVTGTGSQDHVVASVPAATGSPVASAKTPPGEPPPATASAFVYSPQQAVATPGGSVPSVATPGGVPAEPPREDDAEPVAPPGELQLVVIASATQVAAGEIVTVDVMAATSTAVVDAPLHLSFDPTVIAYVDGAPGDFLAQGGSSVVFLADGLSRPGDVAIAVGRVGREQGARGSGLLCRVRFRGAAAGTSAVSVGQAKAWDDSGELLTVRSAGTAVVVR